MKATRKIVFYLSLVLITGLMMIPCAVKQQIKSSVILQAQTQAAEVLPKRVLLFTLRYNKNKNL